MARRPKKQSLIEIAITGSWIFSAILAGALFIFIYVVMPSVDNPMFKPMVLILRPLCLFLMAIFGIMASVKFLLQNKSKSQSTWVVAPSPVFEKTYDDPVLGVLANSLVQIDTSPPTVWTLKLIQEIEWKRFEELSTAYYLEKGIHAEATSLGADGGIDIKLYQDDSGNPTSIVQCKAWNSKQVGVKEIREFLGVMTHEKITKGFYMTSGEYSLDAKETALSNKITLINGEMFLAMINLLSEASQQKLLALATAGDYKTPTCASCGVKMVSRSGSRGKFWGCSNYPRCKQMIHMKKGQ